MQQLDKRYVILFTHLISPLVILGAFYYLTIPYALLSLTMFFLMRCIGSVITYHRILGHNSHKFRNKVLEIFCISLGFYGSMASPIGFCASHTLHHKYVDTDKDPHPSLIGWKRMFPIYWNNSGPMGGDVRTVVRLMRNKTVNFYETYYWYLIFLPIVLLVYPKIFLFLFLLPMCLTQLSLSLSTLNHDGTGPKDMGIIFGILTCGEHHHVWHHNNPGDTSGEGLIHNIANCIGIKN